MRTVSSIDHISESERKQLAWRGRN